MGLLVDGVWQQDSSGKEFGARTEGGQFIRRPTVFHNYVTADGSPGPTGVGGFAAERDRYHLYVSLACPWAHRTLIFRKLKKLEDVISVSVTVAHLGKEGWEFGAEPGGLAHRQAKLPPVVTVDHGRSPSRSLTTGIGWPNTLAMLATFFVGFASA